MRRVLGVGVGILSIEFLAGTVDFLWPNLREGLGGKLAVGSAADIVNNEPEWATGLPYAFQQARSSSSTCPPPSRWSRTRSSPEVGAGSRHERRPGRAAGRRVGAGAVSHVPAPRLPDPAALQPEPVVRMSLPRVASTPSSARSGTARRRAAWTASTSSSRNGVYVIDTSEMVVGPPIGTDTFDPRTTGQMPALRRLTDARQDARRLPDDRPGLLHRRLLVDRRIASREPSSRRSEAALLEYGEELFGPTTPDVAVTANCAQCHGPDGKGGEVGDTGRQAPEPAQPQHLREAQGQPGVREPRHPLRRRGGLRQRRTRRCRRGARKSAAR